MPNHGTVGGYVSGCRCDQCRAAKAFYDKRNTHERRTGNHRLVPALGFRRRVRALQAIGYAHAYIAQQLGLRPSCLAVKMTRGDTLHRRTHQRMADLYNQLSMVLPPDGLTAKRARMRAQRLGWPPPLAWDNIDDPNETPTTTSEGEDTVDMVLVQRGLDGRRVHANQAERAEIARRWQASGRSLRELARLQGWNLWRDRKEPAA